MRLHVSRRVVSTDANKYEMISIAFEIFSVQRGEMVKWWSGGGVMFSEIVTASLNSPHLCRAWSYIMYLLGTILFVDKSSSRTKPITSPLIQDIYKIPEYSSTSTCLAYLYLLLASASRAEGKQTSGCLILLEALYLS